MNPLAHHLGLSPALSFHDVLSFSDPDLLASIPRPVHALLFLYYTTPHSQGHYRVENATTPHYIGSGAEPVLWYHQTITHACGLIGLLHCVTNGMPGKSIREGSILSKFIEDATPLGPKARAQLIYDSAELEVAHFEAAKQGDSIAPDVHNGADVEGAFVAFVKSEDGRMWELEGRRKGPVERGHMAEDEDLLGKKAIELGPMAYVKREEEADGKELRFSCLALAGSLQ